MKQVLVIAGPSAGGKTTVATGLIDMTDGAFEIVRSLTTREPRGDLFDGEYLYTDREGFERELSRGRILEHTEYSGELYGTPVSEIERIISSGKTPILILDLNGISSVLKRKDVLSPCVVYVYCHPTTFESRLRARYLSDNNDPTSHRKYKSRLEKNFKDYESMPRRAADFYAFLCNESSAENTAAALCEIFDGFCSGKEKDEASNIAAAELIKRFADEK